MDKYPSKAQALELLSHPNASTEPVFMLNLLRYKDNGKGREMYDKYAKRMKKHVESKGGMFIWVGDVSSVVIGKENPGWHSVAIVRYPSRAAFLQITSSDELKEIMQFRADGLESQWLIACDPMKSSL